MEEMISIIVPVYNVVGYLDQCIQSILNQTYRNIEIILVDDGSTDGSEKLCDEYGSRDERIVVIHKKNGGSASARNAGLDIAKGDYIGFVDDDDYIALDMYECMMKCMKNDVDMVCCGIVRILPDKKEKMYCMNMFHKYSNLQAMEGLLTGKIGFNVFNKLHRKKLFDNLRFPEGKASEDMPVSYVAMKMSRNIIHTGQAKYFYRYRADSTVNSDFSRKRVALALFARDFLKDVKKDYPKLEAQAEALYLLETAKVIKCIRKSSNSQCFSDIENRLKKAIFHMIPRILCNQYLNTSNKKDILKVFCEE